ncbi:unnamed protein product [Heterosigma akashiwo]
MVVYGTYASDFNAVEYIQRLRHYLPELKEQGIQKQYLILNASPEASLKVTSDLGLPAEVTVLCDEFGEAGRSFGCARGWRPDDKEMSPYVKLFGMLWGLGAWATLPSVLGGYLGNPWAAAPWVETALAQGQAAGRWPGTALVLGAGGEVVENRFAALPGVGGWGRRPLELATLRLQNMVGLSLKDWEALKPSDAALAAGVLTQLGGCAVYGPGGEERYAWRDAGICHVARFEDLLETLQRKRAQRALADGTLAAEEVETYTWPF